MANFEWLNEIPDHEWERADGGGLRRTFGLNNFVRRSEADPETWRREFDGWKFDQRRVYETFNVPPFEGMELIMVTVGFRDA
ncbi:hypothetical protein [Stenotrophomonas maltophilia]|uniref:hypothetical protein n=1 Tax=Stenotrophomonas maltophilia TaxID=40324 RepID=UPI00076DEB4F|nr:hypothetical protein [Stenotrophomonas maltophilia]KWV46117.1 hypothetical protein AS591_17330 [Stenotrophomonas maltophilia]MBA0459991.1 hypothetical protein [Stenotrophomonas maltophilia]